MTPAQQTPDPLYGYAFAGLAGALLTGLGEGLLQLTPGSNYADPHYTYFGQVPEARLFLGHFISIASAPLYIAGYWHLTANLLADHRRARLIVFAACAYAFIIGTVWIGQRAFLGMTVQAINAGRANAILLAGFSALNEPLVNVLRIALVGFSVLWILRISSGRTRYPRWMALLSPAVLIAAIFAAYSLWPEPASFIVPTALNTAHVLVFSASLYSLRFGAR